VGGGAAFLMMKRALLVVLAVGSLAAGVFLYRARIQEEALIPAGHEPSVPPALSVAGTAQLVPARASDLDRLDARRELYESVDSLVQASEFEKARRLLDEDQARFGDDLAPQWRDLEQSYRLIADCLEHPTAQLRSRAQAFVVVSEAHGLKPRLLSACQLSAR
jgi:hypothetical protein